jgi:hypothetical protein
VAWVDYFGIPVFVSAPFLAAPLNQTVTNWPMPSPSEVPPGLYTLHVLLQGNGELFGVPLWSLVFTTVAETTTFDPGLNTDCTPIATASASTVRAATAKPSPRVLARRVKAARRDSDEWFQRSLGPRAAFPKARFCGGTICVQQRAGAVWKPVTGR